MTCSDELSIHCRSSQKSTRGLMDVIDLINTRNKWASRSRAAEACSTSDDDEEVNVLIS